MSKKTTLIIGILIGLITATTIGVTASVIYNSSEIGFTPTDPNWKVNNLESALNDLYAKGSFNLEYVGVAKGGKNLTASDSNVTLSKQLASGKYLVIVNRAAANSGATTDALNTGSEAGSLGSFSGYSTIENLLFSKYGPYYYTSSPKVYAGQYLSLHIITMEQSGTLSYSYATPDVFSPSQ